MRFAIFITCLILIFKIASCSESYEVENCSTTVPSGYNDAQPSIIPFSTINNFTVIELDSSTGARCLDGTNYKFYLNEGSGPNQDKWIFYFQGASFCGGDGEEPLESCYGRLSTQYGTSDSHYWGETGSVVQTSDAWGWFSSNPEYNPMFCDWKKVLLISCDGANFQGSLDEPLYYNDTPIYFRGFNNTMATIEYLTENYGLFDASAINLGGGSSGATASYVWMAYLQDYFPSTIRLAGTPDAGLFIDTYSQANKCYLYRFFMQSLVNLLDLGQSPLYRRCDYRFSNSTVWKCLMVQYMFDTIDIPVFIMNSQNDFKQLTNLAGLGCINTGGLQNCNEGDRKIITNIRESFLKVVMKIKEAKPDWKFWLRTCFEHTYHFTWAWYGHEMDVFSAESRQSSNVQEALNAWYEAADRQSELPSYIDLVDWLHNPMCHYGPNLYGES